eukprot:3007143-Pleurochrysis_carterae.AAC.1
MVGKSSKTPLPHPPRHIFFHPPISLPSCSVLPSVPTHVSLRTHDTQLRTRLARETRVRHGRRSAATRPWRRLWARAPSLSSTRGSSFRAICTRRAAPRRRPTTGSARGV